MEYAHGIRRLILNRNVPGFFGIVRSEVEIAAAATARNVNAHTNSRMQRHPRIRTSLYFFGFHVEGLAHLAEAAGLQAAVADDMGGDLQFSPVSERIDLCIDSVRLAPQLDMHSSGKKKST